MFRNTGRLESLLTELSELVGGAPVGVELREDGWVAWCTNPMGVYSSSSPMPQKNGELAVLDAILFMEEHIAGRAHGTEG
jgi:hypothetical protein